jgi:hypothetical protein
MKPTTVRHDWRATRAVTGTFIRTPEDHILARVCSGIIYLWDRHNKEEYAVPIEAVKEIKPER